MKTTTSDAKPSMAFAISILISICIVYFFSYMQRVAVPGTIFDELQTAFKASASAITALSVIFFYIYGGLQLFVGTLTDRMGVFSVLLIGGILLCAGAFIFPMAHTLFVLYTGRVLIAIGGSLLYACIVKSLDILFTAQMFPIMLGVSISVGYAGGLVGTQPFAYVVEKWGWREVLLAIGLFTLIAFIISVFMLMNTRRLKSGNLQIQGLSSLGTVLRNNNSYPVMLIGAINFAVYYFFQATLGKKLLHDIYHLKSTTAALFPFIMMVFTIICLLSSGVISRAIGNKRKPIVLFSALCMISGGVVLFCSVMCSWHYIWVLVGYCLLGFTSLSSIMTGTLMKELNPPETVGTAIGLSNGSCYLAAAIYTSIAGLILDHFKSTISPIDHTTIFSRSAYLTIIAFGIVMLLVSFYFSYILKETNGIQTGKTA